MADGPLVRTEGASEVGAAETWTLGIGTDTDEMGTIEAAEDGTTMGVLGWEAAELACTLPWAM